MGRTARSRASPDRTHFRFVQVHADDDRNCSKLYEQGQSEHWPLPLLKAWLSYIYLYVCVCVVVVVVLLFFFFFFFLME